MPPASGSSTSGFPGRASWRPGWLGAQDLGVVNPWQDLFRLPATITATTGPDGHFDWRGIGRDRIAELIISGPTIATAQLYR